MTISSLQISNWRFPKRFSLPPLYSTLVYPQPRKWPGPARSTFFFRNSNWNSLRYAIPIIYLPPEASRNFSKLNRLAIRPPQCTVLPSILKFISRQIAYVSPPGFILKRVLSPLSWVLSRRIYVPEERGRFTSVLRSFPVLKSLMWEFSRPLLQGLELYQCGAVASGGRYLWKWIEPFVLRLSHSS